MSTVINKPFNDLSDTGHSSDYDFCSNVLSTYSLCTCSGDDSNATDSAADDNSAEVGKESDGRGVQSVNEQSENTATEAELKEHNELFLESVRELGTNEGGSEVKSALQFSVMEHTEADTEVIIVRNAFSEADTELKNDRASFERIDKLNDSKLALMACVKADADLEKAIAMVNAKLKEAVKACVEADAELERAKAVSKEKLKEAINACVEAVTLRERASADTKLVNAVHGGSSVALDIQQGMKEKEVHYSNVATPATAADDNDVVVAKVEETESQPVISVPSPTLCSVPQVPVIVLKQWQDSIEAERAFVKLLFDLFPGSFSSGDLDCLRREFGMSSDLFDGIVVLREMTPATDVSISPVVTVEVSIDHLRSKVLEECAIDMSCKKYSKVVEVMHNALVLEPRCTTFMYQMAAALAQLVCSRQQGLSGATEEVSGIDVTHGSVVHYLQLAFHNGETDLIDRVYDDSDFEVLRGTDRLNAFIACVVGEKVATLKSAFPSSRVSDIKYALAECEDDASEAASKLLS